MSTFIIGFIVIGAMVLAGIKVVRDRKNGTCGCGCEHCGAHCHEGAEKK